MPSLYQMEQKAIAHLMQLTPDELGDSLKHVLDQYWSKEHQLILIKIREYYAQKDRDTTLRDYLLNSDDIVDYIQPLTEIFVGSKVPQKLGKKALMGLAQKHEEERIKEKLKDIKDQPLSKIKETLANLTTETTSLYRPKSIGETSKLRIQEKELEKVAPSTGYPSLDYYIRGFVPGNVYTLSGDTNTGKSAICANFAYRISLQGKSTLYLSLEPENRIVDYLASIKFKKRYQEVNDEDLLNLEDLNVQIAGRDAVRTIEDVVSMIQLNPRYDLVVIDHIGYFTSGSNTTEKQANVMKQLASLAKEKQTAIMLIQHLNKQKSDKKSPENNITGSAAFKQDATDVLLLVRDYDEDEFGARIAKNTGAILVRKTKSGVSQGTARVRFVDGSAVIFDDEDDSTPDF